MFGAADSLVPRILPILSLMGTQERLFHTGAPGSGLGAKLANNYLAGSIMIALCESMNMGIRMGLDAKKLAQIFSVSTSKNWLSENSNPVPGVVEHAASTRGYTGGFRLALCKKDIGLAVEAAKMVDARMVIGQTVLKCYESAMENEEFRDMDCSIVYKWLGGAEQ
jgi:3-hydroxyisobutyrate dehydrogenase-like beta-hydroxyacid dehydrogenase